MYNTKYNIGQEVFCFGKDFGHLVLYKGIISKITIEEDKDIVYTIRCWINGRYDEETANENEIFLTKVDGINYIKYNIEKYIIFKGDIK